MNLEEELKKFKEEGFEAIQKDLQRQEEELKQKQYFYFIS